MAINKKLVHFKTFANFLRELDAGNILETSIVFIKDTNLIYTHGKYYNCLETPLSETVINSEQVKDTTLDIKQSELNKQIKILDRVLAKTVETLKNSCGLENDLSFKSEEFPDINSIVDYVGSIRNDIYKAHETITQTIVKLTSTLGLNNLLNLFNPINEEIILSNTINNLITLCGKLITQIESLNESIYTINKSKLDVSNMPTNKEGIYAKVSNTWVDISALFKESFTIDLDIEDINNRFTDDYINSAVLLYIYYNTKKIIVRPVGDKFIYCNLGTPGFYTLFYDTGMEVSSTVLNNANVNFFTKLPTFYYKCTNIENRVTFNLSLNPMKGWKLWDTNMLIGTYISSQLGDVLKSKPYVSLLSQSISMNDAIDKLKLMASDYSLLSWENFCLLSMLYLIRYKNLKPSNIGFTGNASSSEDILAGTSGCENPYLDTNSIVNNTLFLGITDWFRVLESIIDLFVNPENKVCTRNVKTDELIRTIEEESNLNYYSFPKYFKFDEFIDLVPKSTDTWDVESKSLLSFTSANPGEAPYGFCFGGIGGNLQIFNINFNNAIYHRLCLNSSNLVEVDPYYFELLNPLVVEYTTTKDNTTIQISGIENVGFILDYDTNEIISTDGSFTLETAGTHKIKVVNIKPSYMTFNYAELISSMSGVLAWGRDVTFKASIYSKSFSGDISNLIIYFTLDFDGVVINSFYGSSISTVPKAFKASSPNLKIVLDRFFLGCKNLTTINVNIFDDLLGLISVDSCFASCINLTTIPEKLFAKNTKIKSFNKCFLNCTNLETMPIDDDNTPIYKREINKEGYSITTGNSCFYGCEAIQDKDNIPTAWKTLI